jgi:hypothetical protein
VEAIEEKGWNGGSGKNVIVFLFIDSVVRILGSPTKVSGQKRLRLLHQR